VAIEENVKLAFEAARDTTKQMLTLASAILAVTITFSTDIAVRATPKDRPWLYAAWVLYAVSVLAGSATLMPLTGNLERATGQSVYASAIRIPATAQAISFVFAIFATVLFGFFALPAPAS
jgi:hypothetical protein